MRAMVVEAFDRPLALVDLPEPELKPGHALLEVLACGVCYSDLKTSRGAMPFSAGVTLPHVPGHEICARVIETDPRGALPVGTRVVVHHLSPCRRCAPCRKGLEVQCLQPTTFTGFTTPGGFQERLTIPLDRLSLIPEQINSFGAAPLTCALGTAYRAVVTRGGCTPGSKVAVIGLGGVGIHALQAASALGARVVGLDISRQAVEQAVEMGLAALPASGESSAAGVLEVLEGPADIVVDVVGTEDTIAEADRMVARGGRIVVVGYSLSSSVVLPTSRLVIEEIEVVGSRYASLYDLDRVIELVAAGRMTTVVDHVLPLEEANAAFDALDERRVTGRIVLDVAGTS
jgi:D-arabinose 1-dehydrogenase-like Zn-dependent alcohol dehydrogenase